MARHFGPRPLTPRPTFRWHLIVACTAWLIGIPSTRYADVERVLRSDLNLRFVASVVALRLLRKIGVLTGGIVAVSRRLCGSARNIDDTGVAAKQPTTEFQPGRDESEAPRIPKFPASSGRRPFPRHIFQTWKSKTQLPENFARWSESVKVRNANFEYLLWDDFDNRKFIADCYPWFLAVYDAYPKEIFRVDAVRYFLMYQFGGVYLDMDTECLKPLAPLFSSSADVWLGRMGDDADFPHSIPNAIMASRPLQEFWLLAMHFLVENATTTRGSQAQVLAGPEAMTGPVVLKKTYETYVSGEPDAVRKIIRGVAGLLPVNLQPEPTASTIELLEPNSWYPMNWANVIHGQLLWEICNNTIIFGDRVKRWLFPRSYLVTYWSHSWKAAP